LKRLILIGLALFVAIQVVRPARTNPPSDPAKAITTRLAVPADVKAVFDRSCSNCHSHQTVWPWYSNVAPISWDVIAHVNDGRGSMNFSDWPEGPEEAGELLDAVCDEVLGRPVSNPLTAVEAKDYQTLVAALATAYRPYLQDQLNAASNTSQLAEDVGRHCPEITEDQDELRHHDPLECVVDLATEDQRRAGWAVRREYRSTYRDTLVSSEKLIAGKWWAPGTASTRVTSAPKSASNMEQ
jgi:mono/diheme cytochrome c family protein